MQRSEILAEILKEIGRETTKVSLAELSLILKKVDGSSATEIRLFGETDVQMNVGGKARLNSLADEKVRKITMYEAMINFNYANAVNNQLQREGKEREFESGGNWHEKKYDEFNGCVHQHVSGRGEYLAFKQLNTKKIATLINDIEASAKDLETIEKWKKPYYAPKNQGTEIPIDFRTIMLKNIVFLKMKGQVYEVVQE